MLVGHIIITGASEFGVLPFHNKASDKKVIEHILDVMQYAVEQTNRNTPMERSARSTIYIAYIMF